ncbi:ROK family protein [Streptomyces sp. NPDC051133]|uniref:ROK family protein n=1 Tax=Streptomyces sp. NPDC051133 TaxID=3155521 RepID=UPI0034339567
MPASPSTARAINDRLALRLLQQEGPLTAGQLKQLTGLSRPTVADLVERLAASGLITVVGESGEQRRGPNARLYGIVADRAHLAALDVRTGGVFVLVSDLVGRVLAETSVPIRGDAGTGPAVEQAVAAVERTAKEAGADRLHTVGIGAPGLIDPATGDLRDSAGLPAWHRSLAAALQERLPDSRVTVENETNLAALAEQREGAARDRDTFVLLWLGHGVGAAVVLDGTLRRGASGGTGEIGFLPVPGTASLPSTTDCDGGFHALAGAAAIGALGRESGLPVPGTLDGPGAAVVVRGAVARVTQAPERPAGSASGPGAGEHSGAGTGEAVTGAGPHGGAVPGDAAAGPGPGPGPGEHSGAGRRDSTEPAQPAQPAQPTESTESAEPIERTDSAESVEPVESIEPTDSAESVESTDSVDSAEPIESAESAESTEPAQPTKSTESVESTEPTDSTEPADSTEPTESAEPIECPPTGPAPVDAGAAARFLDALADRIVVGVASVVAVLDPGCVVLGGEVGQAGGAALARRVEERLRRMSPLATEVRASGLGGGAVLRGALLTARERAQDELFPLPERA